MKQKKKPTTPGIPKRSSILVLTGPYAALLRCSDENRCIQHGMVVGFCLGKVTILIERKMAAKLYYFIYTMFLRIRRAPGET